MAFCKTGRRPLRNICSTKYLRNPSASVNGNPQLADSDPVTIIYTSGTSGEAKGVVLTAGNVAHMLGCTSGRLDLLMENRPGQDRVFHYLPFCFAGSWIMLLTCLLRRSLLTLNTDLGKLAGEMRTVAPDYFLNVPALLERMRKAVDEQLWKTGGLVARNLQLAPRRHGCASRKASRGFPTRLGWPWRIRWSFPPSARR